MSEKTKRPFNVFILGASFAGLSAAHHFLDHTIATLGRTSSAPTYRLIVISPSTHFYWNIAAPRALVSPDRITDTSTFTPIEPGLLRRHKHADVVFIQGLASAWDTEARIVQIQTIGPRAQKKASQIDAVPKSGVWEKYTIAYHAVILATGSSAHSALMSLHGPHTKTMAALRDNHLRVEEASSVVVAGGGPSGVETAGQLATRFKDKCITLVMATSRALPRLPRKVGMKAERQLRGLGVVVMRDVRMIDAADDFGKTRVVLSNREVLVTDVYVTATGVSPNTAFVPLHLLDEGGYVLTDPQTLRVEGAGERVYAIGDCASYSANCVLDCYIAVPPLMANLRKDLWAAELRDANPYGGSEEEIGSAKDTLLERPDRIESQLCPITRFGGVGIHSNKVVPSMFVYLAKGRDYDVGKAQKVVENGENSY